MTRPGTSSGIRPRLPALQATEPADPGPEGQVEEIISQMKEGVTKAQVEGLLQRGR